MRLTPVLNLPPKFRYWKDFGAGRRHRMPYFKQWWHIWRNKIWKQKLIDHTLALEQLPPGSRIIEAQEILDGHLDATPADIIRNRTERIVYDHPWPFNLKPEPEKTQELMYCYDIETRLFVPRDDCQVLTNTLLEDRKLEARPPVEPSKHHIDLARRQYAWSTEGDSVLVRQPGRREYPKINLRPMAKYGLSKERQELNVLTSLNDLAQTLMARHYSETKPTDGHQDKVLDELLARNCISFPYCQVPLMRQGSPIKMELSIESMWTSPMPLKPIENNPMETCNRDLVDIKPRTWRSVLEKSSRYRADWSFALPRNVYPHTIHLSSRIKRNHRDSDEMMARCMIHSFGLARQYARIRWLANSPNGGQSNRLPETWPYPDFMADEVKQDLSQAPVVLQSIGIDLAMGQFHFMRYQLNSVDLDGDMKNQAWYSGPITDIAEALRYYLDFQAFSPIDK